MLVKYIKNIDTVNVTLNGQRISPGDYYEINTQKPEVLLYRSSQQVINAINNDKVVFALTNDGLNDLSKADSLIEQKYIEEALEIKFLNNDVRVNGLESVNVQDAIEEVYQAAQDSSRSYTFISYGGNANSGRYLELYNSIGMDEAPLYSPDPIEVITIVSRTTASDSTCTIGWYDIEPTTPVLLHTTTFNSDKQVVENGGTQFTLPAGGQLAAKIDSGSINKPHVYFVVKGGT